MINHSSKVLSVFVRTFIINLAAAFLLHIGTILADE